MFAEESQGPGVGNFAKEKERTKSKSLELTLSLIHFTVETRTISHQLFFVSGRGQLLFFFFFSRFFSLKSK